VRDDFRGKALVNAVIDLPFALSTVVAGLALLVLYGRPCPVGGGLTCTRGAIVLGARFASRPFVLRTVPPVPAGLGVEMEEAGRVPPADLPRLRRDPPLVRGRPARHHLVPHTPLSRARAAPLPGQGTRQRVHRSPAGPVTGRRRARRLPSLRPHGLVRGLADE